MERPRALGIIKYISGEQTQINQKAHDAVFNSDAAQYA
jgi:hypothetical protein